MRNAHIHLHDNPLMKRWLRCLGGALLIVTAIVFGTGWYLLAGSVPTLDGQVQVEHALAAPVKISRDKLGVATITAHNREDLAYALGFTHGQERFFQMDLLRRSAAGELAALVGPAAIKMDRDHRRHRFRERAHARIAQLPASSRTLLDAYRDGVNAGLRELRVRPWEYLLLGKTPAPWRDEDTLLVIDAMFLDLNGNGTNTRELNLARLRAVLPAPLVSFLGRRDGRWEAPLQGPVTPPPVIPSAAVINLRQGTPTGHESVTLAAGNFPGSNNFAVAGALTGGAAIVANDMHLGLRVPDIWFRARMRYPGSNGHAVDLNGLTLPGTPLLIAGSNGHIAWGFTNSYGDWMDWVRILRKPGDPSRYRVPGGWARFRVHHETIEVSGQAPQHETVRDTRWGPIMARDTEGTPLALAWIAQLPRTHNLNLLKLEQTQDVHDALAIAPTIGMPPQNFVVGDTAGNIGWTLTGNALPLREGFDPGMPADWSQAATGWTGFARPAQFPRIENPADDRLWTANNRTTGGAWLQLLGDGGFALGARAQQIRNDLRAHTHFKPRDLLSVQLDDHAIFLTRWHTLLQATLRTRNDHHLDAMRRLVTHWSGHAGIHSVSYRIVRAFRVQVTKDVLAPFNARLKKRFPDFSWPLRSEAAVWALLQKQPMHMLAPRYPSWNALLVEAARKVNTSLSAQPGGLDKQTWGKRNIAQIDHPLAAALPPIVGYWLDMRHQPLPGDHYMPRVQAPAFGASERFGIQPGNEAHSYLHMPGGQSDNPLSPFYGAGHQAWVHGRPTPLLPGTATHHLTLTPDNTGT